MEFAIADACRSQLEPAVVKGFAQPAVLLLPMGAQALADAPEVHLGCLQCFAKAEAGGRKAGVGAGRRPLGHIGRAAGIGAARQPVIFFSSVGEDPQDVARVVAGDAQRLLELLVKLAGKGQQGVGSPGFYILPAGERIDDARCYRRGGRLPGSVDEVTALPPLLQQVGEQAAGNALADDEEVGKYGRRSACHGDGGSDCKRSCCRLGSERTTSS